MPQALAKWHGPYCSNQITMRINTELAFDCARGLQTRDNALHAEPGTAQDPLRSRHKMRAAAQAAPPEAPRARVTAGRAPDRQAGPHARAGRARAPQVQAAPPPGRRALEPEARELRRRAERGLRGSEVPLSSPFAFGRTSASADCAARHATSRRSHSSRHRCASVARAATAGPSAPARSCRRTIDRWQRRRSGALASPRLCALHRIRGRSRRSTRQSWKHASAMLRCIGLLMQAAAGAHGSVRARDAPGSSAKPQTAGGANPPLSTPPQRPWKQRQAHELARVQRQELELRREVAAGARGARACPQRSRMWRVLLLEGAESRSARRGASAPSRRRR
jgi:hypothetical protein